MKQPLVTILTAPKPFTDPHINIIQTNALRSWVQLGDMVDILVLGEDAGIKEAAQSLDVSYFPDVVCNEKGTPLISSMLENGRELSQSPFLAIVNTDVILFPDFVQAIINVAHLKKDFLIIGQRWDMEIQDELGKKSSDFDQLRKRVPIEAKLHPPTGSDYFIFPRTSYLSIPDLAIGRAGWDNWFIFKSRWEGWPVIDATKDVMAVHQSHDYAHLPGGQPHYRLPETRKNVLMGGGEHTIFSLFDAQYDLIDGKLVRKKFALKKICREIEIFPLAKRRSQFFGKLFFYLFHPKKAYLAIRRSIKI